MLEFWSAFVTYRNLKIHHLVRECRHFVIEAEPILSWILRGEDEITLPFFLPFHYFLVIGPVYRIVDIERAAGLNLTTLEKLTGMQAGGTYSKIKGDFGILSLDGSKEAGFLIGAESVCQGCPVDTGDC